MNFCDVIKFSASYYQNCNSKYWKKNIFLASNNSFKLVFIYLLQITIYAEFELTHSSSRPFHSIEKYQITVTIMVSLIPADL